MEIKYSDSFLKHIKKPWILVLACTIGCILVILLSVAFYLFSLPTLDSLVKDISEIKKPIFLTFAIDFDNLNGLPVTDLRDKIKKPDLEVAGGFFIIRAGNTEWICDKALNKAYRPLPAYNLLESKTLCRILPDENSSVHFSRLKGMYKCTGYICEDPAVTQSKKVVNIYIKECEEIKHKLFIFPVNKIISYQPVRPTAQERQEWLDHIKAYYPPQPIPPIKDNDTASTDKEVTLLLYSVPQGLKVFVAREEEMRQCYVNGAVQEDLVIKRVINPRHFLGNSPIYIGVNPHTSFFVFYDMSSTNQDILPDGQVFEYVEQLSDTLYRIVRGYYVEMRDNRMLNTLQIALFQLSGLSIPEIMTFVGPEKRFGLDEDLFNLFINPLLKQAIKEDADVGYTPQICRDILEKAGKLTIETQVGTYRLTTLKKQDRYTLATQSRLTRLLLRNKKVVKELPNFIYRK